jgi:ankyrin repeat protein
VKYLKICVALFSLIIFLPKNASACNCFLRYQNIEKEVIDDRNMYDIKHHNIIFAGKLTEIKTDSGVLNGAIDFNPKDPKKWTTYGGIKYTFEVWKQWKGTPLGKTTIVYESAGAFLPSACSIHFKLNEEYLIYSAAPKDNGTLDMYPVAVCSPTVRLSNSTAFSGASVKRQADLLNLIEKHGFEKVVSNLKKDRDVIPAAAKGDIATIKALLDDGANLKARDFLGNSALIAAIDGNHSETAKFLIDKGAEIDAEPQWMRSVIAWAVLRDMKDIVEILLQKGVNINTGSEDETTPLIFAAKEKNEAMVRFLVGKGADVNIADAKGNTPLRYAVCDSRLNVAEFLIGKGGNINARDQNEKPILAWAANCGNTKAVRMLFKKGAAVNETGYKREPAWMWAVERGSNIETLKFFFEIDKNIDVNTRIAANTTALMIAARNGRTDAVRFLIERGADLNVRQVLFDNTALMFAVLGNYKDIVALLVNKGADLSIKNNSGMTALDLAESTHSKEIINLLKAAKDKQPLPDK